MFMMKIVTWACVKMSKIGRQGYIFMGINLGGQPGHWREVGPMYEKEKKPRSETGEKTVQSHVERTLFLSSSYKCSSTMPQGASTGPCLVFGLVQGQPRNHATPLPTALHLSLCLLPHLITLSWSRQLQSVNLVPPSRYRLNKKQNKKVLVESTPQWITFKELINTASSILPHNKCQTQVDGRLKNFGCQFLRLPFRKQL